ncbi:MAG: hypothetical protein HQM16_07995 [Deltaproteobacteria bacterium]|nr:hypothetical protein [Deltaproteobacteria bacterium]
MTKITPIIILCFLVLVLVPPPASARKRVDYTIDLAFENLNFIPHRERHALNHQETLDLEAGLTYHNEKNLKINLKPRLRIDFADTHRNRYIPNEAYLKFYGPHFEIGAGMMIKGRGVASFYNPTNFQNRRDYADNGYTPETLGDLMVSASCLLGRWGPLTDFFIEAALLPLFLQTLLPENDTRFAVKGTRGLVPYEMDVAQATQNFLNSMAFSIGAGASLSSFDWSLLYYHGPERDPGFYFTTNTAGALRLKPFYYTTDSLGINGEFATGSFVFSLEAALNLTGINDFKTHTLAGSTENVIPSSYFQFIPGVSYEKANIFGQGQLTLKLEYLGEDDRNTSILKETRPFKNDLFAGVRYAFNNTRQSEIDLGVIKDLSNVETLLMVSVSSKIVREFKLGIQGVVVNRSGDQFQPLSFFENNSYIMTRVSYAFGGGF